MSSAPSWVLSGPRTTWTRYAFAIIVSAVAGALSAGLIYATHQAHAALALVAGILITGWYAGTGPATVALVLAVFMDTMWPALLYGTPHPDVIGLRDVWFVGFAVAAAHFGTTRRNLLDALQKSNARLETEVAARTSELRRSESYLQEALRLSKSGYWSRDPRNNEVRYWSEDILQLFGLDPKVDVPSIAVIQARLHPRDRDRVAREIEEAIQEERPYRLTARITLPSGERRIMLSEGRPYRDERGNITEYFGIITDITEQRRTERALRRARERSIRERFAARLDERNRIARELHDTLLQGFTGVTLKLLAVTNRIHTSPEEVRELRGVIDLGQRTLAEARNAISSIREPAPAIDEPATLRNAVQDVVRGTSLELVFQIAGAVRPLRDDTGNALVRIAREAAMNAVKHAGASRLHVRLRYAARHVALRVTDNGRGFVVDPAPQSHGGHWGLLGIRERVAQLGGTCQVRSTSGKGTTLRVTVPTAFND